MRVLRIRLQNKFPGPSCTMLGHLEANLRHLGLWAINWEAKGREGREREPLYAIDRNWGGSRAVLSGSWVALGRLRAIRVHLGPSSAILGPSWTILGPSWGHLRAILGHLEAILGLSGGYLALLGAVLGHPGASFGHLGAILEPSWNQ